MIIDGRHEVSWQHIVELHANDQLSMRNIAELRSLLGFLGYYRGYVKDFSKRVKPLYDMLKDKNESKNRTHKWKG